MFQMKQPFFAEGESVGGGDYFPKSWETVFRDSSIDVQPDTDTEDESDYSEEETEEVDNHIEIDDEEDTEPEEAEETDESEEAEPEEDPDIDIGDGKKPVKLSELKKGFLRQSDYTKKTQELATQRKEVETLQESLKGVQGFKTHMDDNPWLWGQINNALQEFNSTGVLPIEEVLQDAQYGKYVNHLMAENNAMKKQLEDVIGERDGLSLTQSMTKLQSDLKAEYGDLVTDDYMSKLQERAKAEKLSSETLKEIAEGYLAKQSLTTNKKDVKSATKKAEAAALQRLAETKRVAPKQTKSTNARPSVAATDYNGGWEGFFDRFKQ